MLVCLYALRGFTRPSYISGGGEEGDWVLGRFTKLGVFGRFSEYSLINCGKISDAYREVDRLGQSDV